MENVQTTERNGILNETTMTLHKQELGVGNFQTQCGHLRHVGQEKLRIVEMPTVDHDTRKCGQCFEEGGGY